MESSYIMILHCNLLHLNVSSVFLWVTVTPKYRVSHHIRRFRPLAIATTCSVLSLYTYPAPAAQASRLTLVPLPSVTTTALSPADQIQRDPNRVVPKLMDQLKQEEQRIDLNVLHLSSSDDHQKKQKRFKRTVFGVLTIVHHKFYKSKANSLESYFRDAWKISRAQVYRFIDCALVLKQLDGFDEQPCRERLCRSLKKLAKNKQDICKLWGAVLARVNNDHEAVTSTIINAVWKDLLAKGETTGEPNPGEDETHFEDNEAERSLSENELMMDELSERDRISPVNNGRITGASEREASRPTPELEEQATSSSLSAADTLVPTSTQLPSIYADRNGALAPRTIHPYLQGPDPRLLQPPATFAYYEAPGSKRAAPMTSEQLQSTRRRIRSPSPSARRSPVRGAPPQVQPNGPPLPRDYHHHGYDIAHAPSWKHPPAPAWYPPPGSWRWVPHGAQFWDEPLQPPHSFLASILDPRDLEYLTYILHTLHSRGYTLQPWMRGRWHPEPVEYWRVACIDPRDYRNSSDGGNIELRIPAPRAYGPIPPGAIPPGVQPPHHLMSQLGGTPQGPPPPHHRAQPPEEYFLGEAPHVHRGSAHSFSGPQPLPPASQQQQQQHQQQSQSQQPPQQQHQQQQKQQQQAQPNVEYIHHPAHGNHYPSSKGAPPLLPAGSRFYVPAPSPHGPPNGPYEFEYPNHHSAPPQNPL
ncbi:hypothetical protein BJ742DRAFT_491979 [Cladochytrium replicatum]|nr:hypothetical protein BJ742DRAFT_491979 [Cladochytrium replicatum]